MEGLAASMRTKRLDRVNELMQLTNRDKESFIEIGFSEDIYYAWMAPSNAKRARCSSIC